MRSFRLAMMSRCAAAAIALASCTTMAAAQGAASNGLVLGVPEGGVVRALVIGIDAYDNLPKLQKAVNDEKAVAEALTTLGFEVVTGENLSRREMNAKLAELTPGEKLKLKKIVPEQHFTKPPPRFTEASLVKELEEIRLQRASLIGNRDRFDTAGTDRTYEDVFRAAGLGEVGSDPGAAAAWVRPMTPTPRSTRHRQTSCFLPWAP